MRFPLYRIGIVAVAAALTIGASSAPADPVIMAAGDIACDSDTPTANTCHQQATSDLLAAQSASLEGLNAVLTLGDNQYYDGTLADFNTYFAPTWGQFFTRLFPAPGNHEYHMAGASGYFDYFNGAGVAAGRAGQRGQGWYSFDIGRWHLIALNSNCADVGGCQAGSPQETWLRQDLFTNPRRCTLAYWHHARFSSADKGGGSGNNPETAALYQALYEAGAELLLAGHSHSYERFAPQNPRAEPDASYGIREIVAGTGGTGFNPWGYAPQPNSVVRQNTTFGVLRLRLHPRSYDWEFLPEAGGTFTDSGSDICHLPPPGSSFPPPPPIVSTVTAAADADVSSTSRRQNVGKLSTLTVRKGKRSKDTVSRAYLHFDLTDAPGDVIDAKLRLTVMQAGPQSGDVYAVPASWSEDQLTWDNAPPLGTRVATSVAAPRGRIEIPLAPESFNSAIAAGAMSFGFALAPASTGKIVYASRDAVAADDRPQLVLTFDG